MYRSQRDIVLRFQALEEKLREAAKQMFIKVEDVEKVVQTKNVSHGRSSFLMTG